MATQAAPAPTLDELTRVIESAAVLGGEAARPGLYPVPGASIAILANDEVSSAAFGVTSVDHPLPVTTDTLFQIGSITKTFLGTLVMRLVEEQLLDLDRPIRTWVPDLRLRDAEAAAQVTLRHCLTHMCGWFGDHFEDHGNDDGALARYVAAMAEIEQQVPLGSVWAYNNAGFCLAGRAVEVVTGQPIETALRERLFAPLRLGRTFFFAHEVITHRVASGHNVFDGKPRVARPWAIPRAENAAGGIISTVGDLLKYARFHMGDGIAEGGYRYLTADSLEQMRTPIVKGPLAQQRGIAWGIDDIGGVRTIGHGGATIGQQALLTIAPEKRFAFAMLANSSQATQLQNAVSKWALERYLGVDPPQPGSHHAGPDDIARTLGTYRNPANDVEIARDGERLVLHQRPHGSLRKIMEDPPPWPAPVTLSFARADRLLLTEGPLEGTQVELLGDGAAPLEWIRFTSRLFRRVA